MRAGWLTGLMTVVLILLPVRADAASAELDPSFGDAGKLALGLMPFSADNASDTVVQDDGKVLFGGRSANPFPGQVAVARLMPSGELDPSYGIGGIARLTVDVEAEDVIGGFTLDPSSGDLLIGVNDDNGGFVTRLNTAGEIDTGFGDGGVVPLPARDIGVDIAVDGEGRINVVSGPAASFTRVTRLLADGSPDDSFGAAGSVFIDDNNLNPRAAELDSAGGLLVSGNYYGGPDDEDAFIVRFDPGGALDTEFGASGIARADADDYDEVRGMTVDSDGDIYLAGYTRSGAARSARLALWGFRSGGERRSGFGVDGTVELDGGADVSIEGLAIATSPDGLIVSGAREDETTGELAAIAARFDTSGTLDAEFAELGVLEDPEADHSEAVVVSGSRILLAESIGGELGLLALDSSGSIDEGFGEQGRVRFPLFVRSRDRARAIAQQGDGKLVIAAEQGINNGETLLTSRLAKNGSIDPDYGENGISLVEEPGRGYEVDEAVITDDGGFVVGGHSDRDDLSNDDSDFVFVKLDDQGALDLTFGERGLVRIDPQSHPAEKSSLDQGDVLGQLVELPGGELLAVGRSGVKLALVKLTAAGEPKPSFGVDGVALLDEWFTPRETLVDTQGRIIVVGSIFYGSDPGFTSVAVARFLADGTPDKTFGSGGVADPTLFGSDRERLLGASLTAEGDLVASGSHNENRSSSTDSFLVRFAPDGTLDPELGGDGIVETKRSGAVITDPTGALILFGSRGDVGDQESDFAASRMFIDGTEDPDFGLTEIDFLGDNDFATDALIDADGRLLIAGYADVPAIQYDYRVALAAIDLSDGSSPDPPNPDDPNPQPDPPNPDDPNPQPGPEPTSSLETTIISAPPPGLFTADRSPTFRFAPSPGATSFECRIDEGSWAACSGPGRRHTTKPLEDGRHLLRVRAVGRHRADGTPALAGFSIFGPPRSCKLEFFRLRIGNLRANRIGGTAIADVILGDAGRDHLSGEAADDCLVGGRGRDDLRAGQGADVGDGGRGHDKIKGGGGQDRLKGGRGRDTLNGGGGRDKLVGGRGRDKLVGGRGRDKLVCGGGKDRAIADRRDRVHKSCERVRTRG